MLNMKGPWQPTCWSWLWWAAVAVVFVGVGVEGLEVTATVSYPRQYFGYSVDVYGNTLAVGSKGYAAFIYNINATNHWTLTTTLLPPPGVSSAYAESLAIWGDYLLVGDTLYNSGGSVFIYNLKSNQHSQTLSCPSCSQSSGFGMEISISGNRSAIGAPFYNGYGCVFVYDLVQGQWTLRQQIEPVNKLIGQNFGSAVGLDGDSLVVGAPNFQQTGAAYIYSLSDISNPTQFLGSSPSSTFGFSASMKSGTVVISSPGFNNNQGKIYIYSNSSGIWKEQSSFLPVTGENSNFGYSVRTTGTAIVVGCPDSLNAGSFYVYLQQANQWFYYDKGSVAGSYNGSDTFGRAVAIYDQIVVSSLHIIYSVYAERILCPLGYYGPSCSKVCSCPTSGFCNGGIYGTGTCLDCLNGYFGLNCSKACSCKNGTCDNDIGGANTGNCLSCFQGYYGLQCDKQCNCKNGDCANTIDGDGTCSLCYGNYSGPDCNLTCSCVQGICDNSASANGACGSCSSGYYGQYCDKECPTACASCSDGVGGSGQCTSCPFGKLGPYCNETCPSNCLTCLGGASESAKNCISCRNQAGWGWDCGTCTCKYGRCEFETGHCVSCIPGFWGPDCTSTCTCKTSPDVICFDGVLGNGTCLYPPAPATVPASSISPSGANPSTAPDTSPEPAPFVPSPPSSANTPQYYLLFFSTLLTLLILSL
eukprot:TRINITY_DN18316_c0_g1_i1.p1 TRINITY_DN18316_c0_g1~~TRINITY_DN18316_c0_g1_i1.p1  ORF type:complete len:700 (+),score=71.10 TRINITY_DN18316_c0_g1_i1:73-2172(+)